MLLQEEGPASCGALVCCWGAGHSRKNAKAAQWAASLFRRGLSNTTRNALNARAFGMGAFATYAQTYAYAGATLALSRVRDAGRKSEKSKLTAQKNGWAAGLADTPG